MYKVIKRRDLEPDSPGIYTVQGRRRPSGQWLDLVTNVPASNAITAYDRFTARDTLKQFEHAIVQYGKE